jgi:hypothetical protein
MDGVTTDAGAAIKKKFEDAGAMVEIMYPPRGQRRVFLFRARRPMAGGPQYLTGVPGAPGAERDRVSRRAVPAGRGHRRIRGRSGDGGDPLWRRAGDLLE